MKARQGSDTVLLQNTDFNGPLTVGLGVGNDNLTMTNMGVTGLAKIRGKAGADAVTIQKGVAAVRHFAVRDAPSGPRSKERHLTISDTTVTVKTTLNGGRGNE